MAHTCMLQGRLPTHVSSSAPRTCRMPRRLVVAAAGGRDDVPANVAEARAWIAAWRAKQQAPAAPAAPSSNGKPGKKAAAAPAAASKGKFGASASFSDGTLVFTADQLKSVDYNDVKLKDK